MKDRDIKPTSEKALTPTMEDYLEAIYNLSQEKKAVRVKDIAERLKVKMPTVTNMLKALSERGMIEYDQIERDQADEDACKMEHSVSSTTLARMVEFMEFVENCPRGGLDWLKHFNEYRTHGKQREVCLERMKKLVKEYDAEVKARKQEN